MSESEQLGLWGESTSSQAPRPARTSAPPITPVEGSMARVADCSLSSPESSPSSDRRGSSLRMFLAFELAEVTGCSPSWRRQATPAGRSWWVLDMSAPPISGTGSGLLPTPNATDAEKDRKNPSQLRRHSPGLYATMLAPLPTPGNTNGGRIRRSPHATSGLGKRQVSLETVLHPDGWLPTPSAQDYGSNRGGAAGRVGEPRPSPRSMLSPTAKVNLEAPSTDKWAGARALRALMTSLGATGTPALARIYGWLQGYPPGWLDDR